MLKLAKVKFLNINYKQSIRPYQRYDLINAIFFSVSFGNNSKDHVKNIILYKDRVYANCSL